MPAFLLVSSNFSSNISNSHDGRASSTPSKYPFFENGMSWYVLANMFSKYFYWRV